MNMDLIFENFFTNTIFKEFVIKAHVNKPPIIGEDNYTWTKSSLINVLRNNSSDYDNYNYSYKNNDLFLEALYLLNEGYLTCETEEYEYLKGYPNENVELLEAITMNSDSAAAYEEILAVSSYSNQITMNVSIWHKLYNAGARNFKYSKRNFHIHAEDLNVIVKLGDISISYFLRAFEKGVKKFIVAPVTIEDKGIVYIFSTTSKYVEYLEKQLQEKKEIKKVFTKIKGDYTPNFPEYNNEILSDHDMVEFDFKGKTVRGFIDILSKHRDYETFVKQVKFNHSTDLFGKIPSKVEVNIYFTPQQFQEADYIVKGLKKTKGVEYLNFYAVNKRNIKTYLKSDDLTLMGCIGYMFLLGELLNPSLQFNLDKIVTDVTSNPNATYLPGENIITVNSNIIVNSAYTNYTLNRIHPNDFVTCVVAHELGHADSRGVDVFDKDYIPRIDSINELSRMIVNDIECIESLSKPELSLINETLDKCKKLVELFEKHYEVVMQSEMNAFIYGLDYISNDNLKRLFQKDNYKTYTNYQITELRPLRAAQEQLYNIQRLIEVLNH